jgi:hypothetical protein
MSSLRHRARDHSLGNETFLPTYNRAVHVQPRYAHAVKLGPPRTSHIYEDSTATSQLIAAYSTACFDDYGAYTS